MSRRGVAVISVTHFASSDADFAGRATRVLEALSGCPGYLRGSLGRSTDDADRWVLITEWENVGSYRRALGRYEVKVHATPLVADALDLPSAYEPLVDIEPGRAPVRRASDRA
jgi:antibiotic biosynthesis monooxygenase